MTAHRVPSAPLVHSVRLEGAIGSGILVSAARLRSGQRIPADPGVALTIVVVLSGAVAEEQRGGTVVIPADTIAVRPRGTALALTATPAGARLVMLQYDEHSLGILGDARRFVGRASTFGGRASIEMAWRVAADLRLPDELSLAALRVMALGILVSSTRYHLHRAHKVSPLAASARRILDREFADPPTTRQLAAEVGCSAEHLTRAFKASYGFTIRGWIRRRRVEQARRLLLQTRFDIGEIAERLGFADAAHFARTFRRATSVSPSQFRGVQGRINPVPEPAR